MQSPWDYRLWSLLCTKPQMVSLQIINENLANRRNHRLNPYERSGTDEYPELSMPHSGKWSGEYQDAPCIANLEYKVNCNINFKADGTVEGSGSSTEGKFRIKGIYNLRSGKVAWRQLSSNSSNCSECGTRVASEFFGEVTTLQGSTHIAGTFLTTKGRYCVMNLMSVTERQTAIENAEALPTLLTGSMSRNIKLPPIKEETSFILKVSSTDRHDMSSKVNCEANKESSYPLLESPAVEDKVGGIQEVPSEMCGVEKQKECVAQPEVPSRMDSNKHMEAALAVFADGESEEEEANSTQEECELGLTTHLIYTSLKRKTPGPSSTRDSNKNVEAAFAVFADSESEDEEACAMQEASSEMDSKAHIEAAFAVFGESESEMEQDDNEA